MNATKDELDRSRRQVLLGIMIGYSVWLIAFLLLQDWRLPIWIDLAILGLGLVGCGYWFFQLLRMLRMEKMLRRQPELADAMNDEYVQQKRWKAWKFAFIAILVCQAVIILVNLWIPFDAGIGAQLTIWVGVVSSIGSFLFYDRESEDA
ncbi:MAG TPA: hypothetical protein VN376_00100 [Longilinea sp.]|nr:hypothetical protein [Longilinea sp.]